jgi:glycosyltransferase involved in cell wall biosynthesis
VRILIVSQVFWPENFRINDLCAELVRRGHDVTVLTGRPNYPGGSIFPEFAENPRNYRTYNGASVVRVPILTRGNGRGIRLALNYLSFAVSASVIGLWRLRSVTFDVMFVYEPSPISVAIPGVALRWRKRVPMVLWVLDLWPETLEAIGVVKSAIGLSAVGKLVSFIYRRCDLILAQSQGFVPRIRRRAGEATPVEYFPSWAEDVFQANSVEKAAEVPGNADAFNVVFAGNIGDAQDFPSILAAAERIKSRANVRWLVVGDGRAAGWVASEILRRGLQHVVLMLGRHPVERMPSFYAHADALLVSLKDEPVFAMTIPGKLQSYLAAGLPIVAMLNGEGADVVRRSGAGLACKAGDAAGLAENILELNRMTREQRQAMGGKGLALARTEFNRDALIGRLERSFERLMVDGLSQEKS